ncbi:hypothetical protein JT305_14995 [Salmonella enterica subsp. enterica serovar Senftenberg]|nr:hypothetical protein [Salmonella enterica subsp. enterica serovar Senftenberg]
MLISPDDIADFRHALKSSSRYRPVVLKNALTDVEIARFAVNQFHFNGVTINSYQDRQYPYGAELAHVLGYVSKINDNDLKALDKKGWQRITRRTITSVNRGLSVTTKTIFMAKPVIRRSRWIITGVLSAC